MQSLSSQYIVDILNNEMQMPVNSVWLRDLNKTILNDNGLYISVGIVSAQVMSNTSETTTVDGVFTEYNTVQQKENVQIDIFSNAQSGITRHWEVIAALGSIYAQGCQEANNFKIAKIPLNFLDTSSAEGGSILKRYTITISALVWYRKSKSVTYYDDFSVEAYTDASTSPVIEFEIDSTTPQPPLGN